MNSKGEHQPLIQLVVLQMYICEMQISMEITNALWWRTGKSKQVA